MYTQVLLTLHTYLHLTYTYTHTHIHSSRTENCTDSDGNTPLHLAVHNDNPQCVKLLLNHGASITTSEMEISDTKRRVELG